LTVLKFQVVYCSRSLLHLYRQCQTFQPLWCPEIRRLANSLLNFFKPFLFYLKNVFSKARHQLIKIFLVIQFR
jgi:hypothetical protein